MHLATQNLLAWESELFLFPDSVPFTHFRKVSVTLFHSLVIGVTILRLVHRWRSKRMWWDDYSTFIVLLVDVMYVVIMWLRFRHGGKHTRFMPKQL